MVEESEGERIWEGDVYVFALEGHPSGRRLYAVLHEGPVDSPEKTVQATIVQAYKRASREE